MKYSKPQELIGKKKPQKTELCVSLLVFSKTSCAIDKLAL